MGSDQHTYTASLDLDQKDRPVIVNFTSSTAGEITVELMPTDRTGLFHARIDDQVIPVMVRANGVDSVDIDLRGYRYQARVLADAHHRLLSILRSSPAMQTRVARITSPMPGLIKTVMFADGQEVAKGATLFTLEAMKMENAIASPIHGTVRQLSMQAGTAVDKGTLLCVIDPIL